MAVSVPGISVTPTDVPYSVVTPPDTELNTEVEVSMPGPVSVVLKDKVLASLTDG